MEKKVKLYGAFVIYVLNKNLEMALHNKKEKLELFSHPFLERVLEEEKFIPQELKIDTEGAVDLSNEGVMVVIANQLRLHIQNMKDILENCEEFAQRPFACPSSHRQRLRFYHAPMGPAPLCHVPAACFV